ncbi:MAG: cytochrome c1 [Gammaproteobacteria bacterium]
MKKLIASIALIIPTVAFAAGGHGPALDKAHVDVQDTASLQRGAKMFVNYCMGCHSMQYMRYNRLAEDLGLTEEQVLENLAFGDQKIGEPMTISMPKDRSKDWFGKTPPDLTVIARSRGEDWLYSFLRGYYADPGKPTGVNNIYFPDVGMPHVLASLQGVQKAVFHENEDANGVVHKTFEGFELAEAGALTSIGDNGEADTKKYDRAVRDLVNFLSYAGEPAQLKRAELGPYVIGFLIIFTILSWFLKKEYWKDVH